MSGEDQERFEDYLELERYIEDMQGERSAHLPPSLTPEQAYLYRMAALLRSTSSGNQEPRPEFVAKLYASLQAEQKSEAEPEPEPEPDESVLPTRKQPRVSRPRRVSPVSRRALLSGGAVAAASLVAGTGLGMAVQATEQHTSHVVSRTPKPYNSSNPPWLLDDEPTMWHYVTTVAQLKNQAVQFSTGAITGYVILDEALGNVLAFSAACTHMGCTVQWQGSSRCFKCPCHGGLFTDSGLPDPSSPLTYLTALPRLRVRLEDDKIYVEVPANL
ncbi:MAG TPA: Rieske (2Fe-2S) protein [Ktedonobacteraceae bacterium]